VESAHPPPKGHAVIEPQGYPANHTPSLVPRPDIGMAVVRRLVRMFHNRVVRFVASGHEKIPVCGQIGPAVRSSEFPADGH
jgi:hypothetical protein